MSGLHILLVDDEYDLREMIKTAFSQGPIKITTATDGLQAEDILKSSRFNAIVTDLNMPRMNGEDLCRVVRASRLNKDTPIIIISGQIEKEQLEKLAALGVRHFLTKPFKIKQLIEMLTTCLKKTG